MFESKSQENKNEYEDDDKTIDQNEIIKEKNDDLDKVIANQNHLKIK